MPTAKASSRRFVVQRTGSSQPVYREVTAYETVTHSGNRNLLTTTTRRLEGLSNSAVSGSGAHPGPRLDEHLEECGPLSVSDALLLVVSLCDIVAACHQQQIVHRDLKPRNILLRSGDTTDPVVVDFGLSFNQLDSELDEVTKAGEEVGNRFLRLPEHATGGDLASDITQVVGVLFIC